MTDINDSKTIKVVAPRLRRTRTGSSVRSGGRSGPISGSRTLRRTFTYDGERVDGASRQRASPRRSRPAMEKEARKHSRNKEVGQTDTILDMTIEIGGTVKTMDEGVSYEKHHQVVRDMTFGKDEPSPSLLATARSA
ncbi:expressed unknown protein [Seminavis robusta]|uniref:Uncharacterized protein n=1 Tax=Seminavis robusta TaxID=568900 RepID=A0A9N8DDY7_9STRA|nr:expressed unknown protein [Seminavis robusta]|eukprot:Sro94_g049150.1 n/a (137) ;mRNA; f:119253-119663